MSKMLVFAVYDSKAEAYGPPFFNRAKGEALRAFMDAANNKEDSIGKHPEDYTLFYIGIYEELKGSFECPATPEPMGKALEMVKQGA